jgi:uncharacterized iron-regulated protein
MRKNTLFLLFICFVVSVVAQDKPAYIIYSAKGKKVSYGKMLNKITQKDIILFGEFHNNAIAHWLQLELTKDAKEKRALVLGAEMFEQDNQEVLDQYLRGEIDQNALDTLARLWKNYPTDYAPLINFAKENKIAFAADNIPRRYATMVAKGSFAALDALSAKEKTWMAPLPIAYDPELPGYKKMLAMMGAEHGGENLPKAQAIKDATMAHFILKYYQPGSLFIHFNGSYHSDNYEGIGWYLKKQRPELKIATITTVSQKNLKELLDENKGKADYIICVDEDMTNTY